MLHQALLMLQTAQGSSDGCAVTYALPSVRPPLQRVGASDLAVKPESGVTSCCFSLQAQVGKRLIL